MRGAGKPLATAGRSSIVHASACPTTVGVLSAAATAIAADTRGVCTTHDTWRPILDRYFASYRPSSVTAEDVQWTFARNRVGHWLQVINGTAFVTAHPEGERYQERGGSVVAQVQRMLARGWRGVPDFDLLFGVGDNPRFHDSVAHLARAPVGAMSSSASHVDVPIPHMGFHAWWESGIHVPSIYTRDLVWNNSINAVFAWSAERPYSGRIRKALFRGQCNSLPRQAATELTRERPDILDLVCEHGMPWSNFSQYAVIANFPGNGWSGRTPWLMATGSPMLYQMQAGKRDNPARREALHQFWYPLLRPYVHYWPVRSTEQIVPAVEYLLSHPREAQRVGEAAAAFVREYLLPESIDCAWLYYAHALAELRSGDVVLAAGAANVTGLTHEAVYVRLEYTKWPPVPPPTPLPTPMPTRTPRTTGSGMKAL